jgi:hypothetical protein
MQRRAVCASQLQGEVAQYHQQRRLAQGIQGAMPACEMRNMLGKLADQAQVPYGYLTDRASHIDHEDR